MGGVSTISRGENPNYLFPLTWWGRGDGPPSSAHSQSESGTQALLVRWAWGSLTLRKVFHLAVLCLSWSIGLRELVSMENFLSAPVDNLYTSFSSEAEKETRGVTAVLLLYPSPQLAYCLWNGFYCSLFNPLPIEGCLPCFQFEDDPNKIGGPHQCLPVMM